MRYRFVDCRWQLGQPGRSRALYLEGGKENPKAQPTLKLLPPSRAFALTVTVFRGRSYGSANVTVTVASTSCVPGSTGVAALLAGAATGTG